MIFTDDDFKWLKEITQNMVENSERTWPPTAKTIKALFARLEAAEALLYDCINDGIITNPKSLKAWHKASGKTGGE